MATTTLLGLTLTLTPTAITALRIAPLISTTASLTHAYMEWLTNSSFLGPAPTNSALSRFLLGADTPPQSAALDQERVLRARSEVESAKEIVVPGWFTSFFNAGVGSVVGFNTVTVVSASMNLVFCEGLGESKVFYQVGLASAVAHYLFVPLVAPSVKALIQMATLRARGGEDAGKDVAKEVEAVDWVKEWVGWHKVRMGSVDVVAWSCFAWAVLGSVMVVT